MTIRLLGRPGIHRPDEQGPRPRGRRTWALLALASLSDRPVPRHQLVRMLFPDAGDTPAALRWSLSELRPETHIDGDPVALDLGRDTIVDAQQVLAGQADPDAGELLAGIDLTDCPSSTCGCPTSANVWPPRCAPRSAPGWPSNARPRPCRSPAA